MASLDFDVEEARFRARYAQQQDALQAACQALTDMVATLLDQAGGVEVSKVEGRVKDVDECIRKFIRKYRPGLEESNTPYDIQTYITDLLGVRVVCLYEDELEKVAQLLGAHFTVIDVTDKVSAVESTEGSFGYKGLHLDLAWSAPGQATTPAGMAATWPFELQVRTIIQDSWSVLDHKIKYKKSIPQGLKRRINVLSALFELADREFRQIRDATEAELQQAPDETEDPQQPLPSSPGATGAVAHLTHRASSTSSPLDAFTFLKIAQHFFKDFTFEPDKVDGFVAEIQGWRAGITRAGFNALMRETIGVVKRYKQQFDETSPSARFNPYTVMRHCLYLHDREAFQRALRKSTRDAFDQWLAKERDKERDATP